VTYIGHELNSRSVELVHKFVVQPKFVELEVELVLAVERVLLIPSLNHDGAISPYRLFAHTFLHSDYRQTDRQTSQLGYVLHLSPLQAVDAIKHLYNGVEVGVLGMG